MMDLFSDIVHTVNKLLSDLLLHMLCRNSRNFSLHSHRVSSRNTSITLVTFVC